ncbi:DUF4377 domain-containing protein [Nonlabens marinus]|uniref:DUF4377 domain-containing protein n=1 Tax=Nonlabens marinus S1-08 TaxID=1454201 RepID=W8VWD8_9FLAO|nr:DUF4377 domain-containing protein [Nonlabens marinus]BAO56233.1 hypothetical protein NMS_2224 [Nonlabens marinus S1-08]
MVSSRLVFLAIPLLILLNSCDSDSDITEGNEVLEVLHYKNVAYGFEPILTTQIKVNQTSTGVENFYGYIDGFNYEYGYNYLLSVNVFEVQNPSADGSSLRYELARVISKTKVPPNTTFKIDLKKQFDNGADLYVSGSSATSFQILNQLDIDCSDSCTELEAALNEPNDVVGIFQHNFDGTIKLVGLER